MVRKKAGNQTCLRTSVRLITDYGDAEMHFARMRLQRGSDRIKPRHHRRELRQKSLWRFETRLVELFEDVHVIARVYVFIEHIAVIDDFHEMVALLALGNALAQLAHDLSVCPVEYVIVQQGLVQGSGLAFRVSCRSLRIKTEQGNYFIHQHWRVAAKRA